MAYLYVKSLHIIFVTTWFAGLFYIIRLFIYYKEAEEKDQIPSYTRLRPRRAGIFGEDMDEFSHPLMDSNDDN